MKILLGSGIATLLVRLGLCAVFLLAALPKLQDPAGFAIDVAAYQVTGAALSAWVAIALPWAELCCALGLLTPWIRRASGLLLTLMLITFMCMHLWAWMRGLDIACGCFGKAAENYQTNYPWLLTRNALLLSGTIWVLLQDFRNNSAQSAT